MTSASQPLTPVSRSYGSRRIELCRGDLTAQATDAIVNAANRQLVPGAGVCGAIRRAGGDAIFDECATIVRDRGPLAPGEVALTGGGRLLARYVLHAVGPVWQGGERGEPAALASCYRECLRLARAKGLSSIAFPSISTGIYAYPVAVAAPLALSTIRAFLLAPAPETDLGAGPSLVRFVLFSEDDLGTYAAELQRLPG